VNPAVKWALLGVLVAVAAFYFAFLVLKAGPLADVLLRRGWGDRGWSAGRLTRLLQVLGTVGFLVALAGIALCIMRVLG
jgi:hypothetical protein